MDWEQCGLGTRGQCELGDSVDWGTVWTDVLNSSCRLLGLDQFGDTILFTTDDEILEAMSRFDDTFVCVNEEVGSGAEGEELQRPQTADEEEEGIPQAGFREDSTAVSVCDCVRVLLRVCVCVFIYLNLCVCACVYFQKNQDTAVEPCAEPENSNSGLYTGKSKIIILH